jgi:glycosyltransferase involved in cell wall biosynthesis
MTLPAAVLPAGRTRSGLIRVASVPAGHVYVRHLADPSGGDGVVRLDDPVPPGPDVPAGQWWPPAMLSPGWVLDHHQEFDVFHVQFGFDAQDADRLGALVRALRAVRKPLVYTVHDLRNPHHPDSQAHDAHLNVLIPQADGLVTLTAGAAAEVAARWGRRPTVLPHPHVVELDRPSRPRASGPSFVIGVHAKSVRASMAPLLVIRALAEVVAALPGGKLRVDIHHDVFDPGSLRHDRELAGYLSCTAARAEIDLRVHDCFSDEELWAYLESLDVSVLPYRFGTHSGWLEACHDLGTTVIAPTCGYFRQQRPCLSYRHDESGFDARSLAEAVLYAYERRPRWQARPGDRLRERLEVAAEHRRLYERVLG